MRIYFFVCCVVLMVVEASTAEVQKGKYVAFAYSATTSTAGLSSAGGKNASCFSNPSAASASAEKQCRRAHSRSGVGSTDCKTLVVSPPDGCLAVAWDPSHNTGGYGVGIDESEAGQSAIQMCNNSSCQVQVSFCCLPDNVGGDAQAGSGSGYTNCRLFDGGTKSNCP